MLKNIFQLQGVCQVRLKISNIGQITKRATIDAQNIKSTVCQHLSGGLPHSATHAHQKNIFVFHGTILTNKTTKVKQNKPKPHFFTIFWCFLVQTSGFLDNFFYFNLEKFLCLWYIAIYCCEKLEEL